MFKTLEMGSEENLENLASELTNLYSYQEKDYDRVLLYVSLAAFKDSKKFGIRLLF